MHSDEVFSDEIEVKKNQVCGMVHGQLNPYNFWFLIFSNSLVSLCALVNIFLFQTYYNSIDFIFNDLDIISYTQIYYHQNIFMLKIYTYVFLLSLTFSGWKSLSDQYNIQRIPAIILDLWIQKKRVKMVGIWILNVQISTNGKYIHMNSNVRCCGILNQ